MSAWIDPFNRDLIAGMHTSLGREIGATRVERDDFLVNQTDGVVRNLLAAHTPPSSSEADGDSSFYPFHFLDFDPTNPPATLVAILQKLAVRTLLRLELRRAQDVQCDAFSWIEGYFHRILDELELDDAYSFEEVWRFLRQLYSLGRGRVIINFYVVGWDGKTPSLLGEHFSMI